jgi:hypothetical protein
MGLRWPAASLAGTAARIVWSLPIRPLRTNSHAVLEDAAVAGDGVAHGPAFGDGDGEGLLAEDVLAGLGGGNGDEGVPVLGRGDDDGIDAGHAEQLPEVAEHGRASAEAAAGGLAAVLPRIADGQRLRRRAEEAAHDIVAPSAEADEAEADAIARRRPALRAQSTR